MRIPQKPALGFLAIIFHFNNLCSCSILLAVSTLPLTEIKIEIIVHKLIRTIYSIIANIFTTSTFVE